MGAKLVEEGSSGVRRAAGPYEEEEAEGDGSGCCGWKGGAGYGRYTSSPVLLATEEIRLPSILVVGPTGEEAKDTSSLHQEKRMRERSPWQEERTRKMVIGGSKGQREKRCGHRFATEQKRLQEGRRLRVGVEAIVYYRWGWEEEPSQTSCHRSCHLTVDKERKPMHQKPWRVALTSAIRASKIEADDGESSKEGGSRWKRKVVPKK
ncbi:hypothetical protein BHE74_00035073 [Ensete ventricosum]|nr:hypothetical protein BHE74_00035073 [Ensete ventricosum]